jgi:hypothetical protein
MRPFGSSLKPPGAIVEIKQAQVSPARGIVRDAWARVATPIEEW